MIYGPPLLLPARGKRPLGSATHIVDKLKQDPVLTSGARVGAYEIVDHLGAGGMGEVYHARDTRLNRDVALKILPNAFALDDDRAARFTREAQTLAALNHPHIARIYGVEESDARRALVMELVEGETPAERVARGPVPLDQAAGLIRQTQRCRGVRQIRFHDGMKAGRCAPHAWYRRRHTRQPAEALP